MTVIGGRLLDAESVGNYHVGTYTPAVRRGPYAIQSGANDLGMQYTLALGADLWSRSNTVNTLKYFAINAPRYQDANFNQCTVISGQGFNADNMILALGGDQSVLGTKGVNQIRFFTAANGSVVPTYQWQIDAIGRWIPQNGTVSLGADGVSVPTIYVTNMTYAASNTAPSNISTVRSWINVIVNGQTFKMPLYQ
jgi:hypothetical protein